jgi:TonB family protein
MSEISEALRRAYPEAERGAGREGQVTVGITIGEDGQVRDVEIIESAGRAFDQAAETVARKMMFEPALVRSVPTAVKVRQVIVFRLTD